MANFEIPSNPEYTEQIRKFETKDPAHADLFNAVIGALLSNDVFLKLAVNAVFQQATGYTDHQIADLINGAPETLNTLGEIAEAMKNNSDVVEALNAAIGTKASQAEVDGHIGNDTIHIKASERENWNDKQTKTGDVQNNIVTFESGDAIEPAGWANVALVTTKEKLSSLMRKLSLTVKNMRYLIKLIGNNQLSVGDGTITGAINALNTGLTWQPLDFNDVASMIGSYAVVNTNWPHNACRCGNLIQLDFTLDFLEGNSGNDFMQINLKYAPIINTYLSNDGGFFIRPDGTCGGWFSTGQMNVHVVYAITPQ